LQEAQGLTVGGGTSFTVSAEIAPEAENGFDTDNWTWREIEV